MANLPCICKTFYIFILYVVPLYCYIDILSPFKLIIFLSNTPMHIKTALLILVETFIEYLNQNNLEKLL